LLDCNVSGVSPRGSTGCRRCIEYSNLDADALQTGRDAQTDDAAT
jgi:hypothetical protein